MMALEITYESYSGEQEKWSGGSGIIGSGGNSATQNTPAKILIADEENNLVSCNYQSWYWGDDNDVVGGNRYFPTGNPAIDLSKLTLIQVESFVSRTREGEDFHKFINNLMEKPPAGIQFIKYEGVERVIPPREYRRILLIPIPKIKKPYFIHRFSLCCLSHQPDQEH